MTPISLFYGIIIYMYTDKSRDLKVPHIHAVYKDEEIIVALTGEVLEYTEGLYYGGGMETGAGEGEYTSAKAALTPAEQEGVDRVRRVVFLSDGENELEAVFQEHFAALPNVARVLDAMHACQYVDTMCKDLEKNPERAAKASRRLRRRLVNAGWEGFAKSFARRFGADAHDRMGEDGQKAWKYLVARKSQMDYASFRRRNIPIGSGMAEAGCKLNLGRLKGPGMHWRFDNGIRIALLRATLRSRMFITA